MSAIAKKRFCTHLWSILPTFYEQVDVDEIDICHQFHQCFFTCFFHTNVVLAAFSSYVLALTPKFRTKNARVNVDEIDTWSGPVSSSRSTNAINDSFKHL